MTAPFIPQTDPRASYLAYRTEIDDAIQAVLQGGTYVLGQQVREFEREFGAYHAGGHAVGVANGTDALIIALRACGIGPGDAVVTVSHTAVATVAAIEQAAAIPIVADIGRSSYTIDCDALEKGLGSVDRASIKAIIPVHLYGQPANMPAVLELAHRHGWFVIEDCAHALGAALQDRRVGTWGNVAAFSFYPTKNLGAIGDGGAVVTSDTRLAERARMLREYGWQDRQVSEIAGFNSRLDELQAAILRVKFRHLEAANERRHEIATRYADALSQLGVPVPEICSGVRHAWHQFVIRHRNREQLRERLKAAGVGTLVHYPVPVHLQPAYRGWIQQAGSLRETEIAAREVVSLPLFPEMTDEQVDRVIEAVRANL